MKKTAVISFLMTMLACIFLTPVTALAQEYGAEYPSYVNYSGGAYIEVVSTFGTGTLVFSVDKKDDTFGFSGNSYNICNLTNSTLSGHYVATDGTEYTCRFQTFSTLEIYIPKTTGNQTTYTYTSYTISKILNTNVNFIDLTDLNRTTDLQSYNFSYEQIFVICFFAFIFILLIGVTFYVGHLK